MTQAIALAVVQETIAARHPNRSIELSAQVHHIRLDGVAFVDVYGCDDAAERRAQIYQSGGGDVAARSRH